MSIYHIRLELKSPALVGSGVGFGANIDSDVVFDDLGLPYIPARRVKGCLLDAAQEVKEMFEMAWIMQDLAKLINETFGVPGAERSAPVYFSNLYLENHEHTQNWLSYFAYSKNSEKFGGLVTPERILETFTEIRQQTKIGDDGVAFEHSLRTIRALRNGLAFFGPVRIEINDDQLLNTLLLACRNFRRFGTKRNRGFGEVTCTLLDENKQPLSIHETLEGLCTA